jgi:hypothetical protein
MKLSGFGQFNSRNFWTQVKQFSARGGFYNGLNPSIVGRIWYVNSNTDANAADLKGPVGSDSNDGLSPLTPFLTIARVLTFIDCYDIVVLSGVFKEQVVAPVGPYDVTFVGSENDPRQATSGGVATGGGASWLAPANPTAATPLIRVISQSWRFINIQFAPVAASACITFDRRETAAIPDSSHGSVLGCYFSTGGAAGLGIEGIEVKKLRIEGNRFEALTGVGGTAIKTTAGLGIANPQHWTIADNIFVQNSNDIIASLDFSFINRNMFFSTNPIEGGQRVKIDGGGTGRNRVILNQFSDIAADVVIAKGYKPGTNDVWNNYVAATAALIVAVPT